MRAANTPCHKMLTAAISQRSDCEKAGKETSDQQRFDVGCEGLTEVEERVANHGKSKDRFPANQFTSWAPYERLRKMRNILEHRR